MTTTTPHHPLSSGELDEIACEPTIGPCTCGLDAALATEGGGT